MATSQRGRHPGRLPGSAEGSRQPQEQRLPAPRVGLDCSTIASHDWALPQRIKLQQHQAREAVDSSGEHPTRYSSGFLSPAVTRDGGQPPCPCPCRDCPYRGRRARPGRLPGSCERSRAASGRSGDSARWFPEESLPSPEPAVRDAVGWLFGGLAASAAPRPGPAATAVLVWAPSTIRPRAAPMTAPSRAPTTTRTWPRWRNDRSTGPPCSNTTLTTLPAPTSPNVGRWIWACPLTSSPRRRSAVSRCRRRPDRQGTHQPASRQGGIPAYGEGRSPTLRWRSSLLALRPAWGLGPPPRAGLGRRG